MYHGCVTQPLQLELDRSAKTPLAEQIRKAISAAIESGVLAPGAHLPSWLDLAAQLGVARGTVRSAYEKLSAAQLIVASRATGTRVADRPPITDARIEPPSCPEQLHCRLQAQLDLSSSVPDAHGWSSEAIDDPKKTVAGSGEMLLRGCRDTEQQTGSRRSRRRIPKRQRRGRQSECQHFSGNGLVQCAVRQWQQRGQTGDRDILGARPKVFDQRVALGCVDSLSASEMPHIVAFAQELRDRELN